MRHTHRRLACNVRVDILMACACASSLTIMLAHHSAWNATTGTAAATTERGVVVHPGALALRKHRAGARWNMISGTIGNPSVLWYRFDVPRWRMLLHDRVPSNGIGSAPFAFDGCKWEGSACWVQRGRGNAYVWLNASMRSGSLGACGLPRDFEDVRRMITRRKTATDDRIYVPLDVPQGLYWAHFLDCLMPKLIFAMQIARKFGWKILIYAPAAYRSPDSLLLLSLLKVDVTTTRPGADIAFRGVLWACQLPAISPIQSRSMQRLLVENLLPAHKNHRRFCNRKAPMIWMSRNAATTRNGRIIANERELLRAINTSTFSSFSKVTAIWGGESLRSKARAISTSCVLVGPHGSAMYHMLWLPPDAVVFELDSDNKYTIFWTLASSLGLKYARLRYKGKLDAQTLLSLLRAL